MADLLFEHPRLAAVYDALDPDRSDLEVYAGIAQRLAAHRVLDVGCGTGTFALLLAGRGLDVVGVDPAAASLDVARAKAGAERVRWLHGGARTLPPLEVDLATMTGNVAQAIADEAEWAATLEGVRAALRPGGRLVFETRDPARRAWEHWTKEDTYRLDDVPGVGGIESWEEVTDVDGPLVTFRSTRGLRGRRRHAHVVLDAAVPHSRRGHRLTGRRRLRAGRDPWCAGPPGPRAGLHRAPARLSCAQAARRGQDRGSRPTARRPRKLAAAHSVSRRASEVT